jgi:hypothetical protein
MRSHKATDFTYSYLPSVQFKSIEIGEGITESEVILVCSYRSFPPLKYARFIDRTVSTRFTIGIFDLLCEDEASMEATSPDAGGQGEPNHGHAYVTRGARRSKESGCRRLRPLDPNNLPLLEIDRVGVGVGEECQGQGRACACPTRISQIFTEVWCGYCGRTRKWEQWTRRARGYRTPHHE